MAAAPIKTGLALFRHPASSSTHPMIDPGWSQVSAIAKAVASSTDTLFWDGSYIRIRDFHVFQDRKQDRTEDMTERKLSLLLKSHFFEVVSKSSLS